MNFAFAVLLCHVLVNAHLFCYDELCDLNIAYRVLADNSIDIFSFENDDTLVICPFPDGSTLDRKNEQQQLLQQCLSPLSSSLTNKNRFTGPIGTRVDNISPSVLYRWGVGQWNPSNMQEQRGETGETSGDGNFPRKHMLTFDHFSPLSRNFALVNVLSRPLFDAWLAIVEPPMGALIHGDVGVKVALRNTANAVDGGHEFMISVKEVLKYTGRYPHDYIHTGVVEPATWVVEVTPLSFGGDRGYSNRVIVEVILSPDQIQQERQLIVDLDYRSMPPVGVHLFTSSLVVDGNGESEQHWHEEEEQEEVEKSKTVRDRNQSYQLNQTMHICVWGNTRMDGQKSIWFDQMAHMDKSLYSWTWVLAGFQAPDNFKRDPFSVVDAMVSPERVQAMADASEDNDGAKNDFSKRLLESLSGGHVRVAMSPLDIMPVEVDTEGRQRPRRSDGTFGASLLEELDAFEAGRHEGRDAPRDSGVDDGDQQSRWNEPLNPYVYSTKEYTASTFIAQRWNEAREEAHISGEPLSLEKIEPPWVRRMFEAVAVFVKGLECDAVVFGNNRGSESDILLVESSRLMGIPSAMELLNVFPDVAVVPDSIIAPSYYAMRHESINYLHARDQLLSAVVSPGVKNDLLFDDSQDNKEGRDVKIGKDGFSMTFSSEKTAKDTRDSGKRPFHIAFAGRLAPEKSPGMFLTMAHSLLTMQESLNSSSSKSGGETDVSKWSLHFLVIGDGPLRYDLEDMTGWLGISSHVTFTGWLSRAALKARLQSVDMLVNPSLRAWSETFCIMNIEAMALRVPIVSFGVGGIGEYIARRVSLGDEEEEGENERNEDQESRENTLLFTPTSNGILVNEATPSALASGVSWALHRPKALSRMSSNARRTVESFFTVQRQMDEYHAFYQQLRALKDAK